MMGKRFAHCNLLHVTLDHCPLLQVASPDLAKPNLHPTMHLDPGSAPAQDDKSILFIMEGGCEQAASLHFTRDTCQCPSKHNPGAVTSKPGLHPIVQF
jgi:hypothetical protein